MKCDHKGKKDLTQGLGITRHYICLDCRCHWYNDKFWSKEEWEEYTEEGKYFKEEP